MAAPTPSPAGRPRASSDSGEAAQLRARLAAADAARAAADAARAAAEAALAAADAALADERRRRGDVEARLAGYEDRFRRSISHMLDGVMACSARRDGAGRVVDFGIDWVNDSACRVLGRSRDELVGRGLLVLLPDHRANGLFDAYVRVVESGNPLALDGFHYDPVSEGTGGAIVDIRCSKLGDGFTLSFRDVTERHEAEEALFRSRQMLRLILDTIPERVFWKDTDSAFVGANSAFLDAAGLRDAAELVGKTDDDMPWAASAARYRRDDREVMTSGEPKLGYEESEVLPDGRLAWLRTSKVPLRDKEGRVIGILGSYENVTDRRRAEESLRQSEQFLNAIVENLPDMVVVKDAGSGRFVRVNQAAERIMGLPREAIVGRTDRELSPADEAEQYERGDLEAMQRGGLVDVVEESHSIGPLGRRILHTKKLPIGGGDGRPRYVLAISQDVTDSRLAQAALRESEARYRHITEATTDYVLTIEIEDGRPARARHGQGCVAVTGYTPEEFDADPDLFWNALVPEDRGPVFDQTRRLAGGEESTRVEFRIVRKDGALRWVRNTSVPRFDRGGKLVAIDGLVQDITERRALQDQLLQAQKMEGIGRLAGGVAHDFNNLLTAILGYVEMARLDLPAELPPEHPARADLDEIAAAGERAASLTRQLLAFASKQIVAPVRLDLNALVTDSLKMLRRLLGENIAVETVLAPGLAAVDADPGQIQQLLVNLTVNARDAMPDGGRLFIESANETITPAYAADHPGAGAGDYVRLTVTDTGVGMSEEVQSHLFEPFFTTKERGKGTGLGLATCHGIVRQLRGYVAVYSEVDRGTTFRIFLPRAAGPADAQPSTSSTPIPTGTERILVVEDEPVVRRLAVLGLRAQGYTVLEAAEGAAALEIAGRLGSEIDLVVSDVVMPVMSGPELAARLRDVAPRARVLLVSGHAEPQVLAGGLGPAETAFLPKPFTPERLARRVREVLDASPARRRDGPAPDQDWAAQGGHCGDRASA